MANKLTLTGPYRKILKSISDNGKIIELRTDGSLYVMNDHLEIEINDMTWKLLVNSGHLKQIHKVRQGNWVDKYYHVTKASFSNL